MAYKIRKYSSLEEVLSYAIELKGISEAIKKIEEKILKLKIKVKEHTK